MNMSQSLRNGFTIVELLVVIIVIGILASVTTSAFNGVQNRALNSSRLAELKAWEKQLEAYHVINGRYPSIANGDYCLGTGFPGGKCRDYWSNDPAIAYNESDAAGLRAQLATVGSLPSGPRKPIDGTVGPYITYWGTGYWISQVFYGKANECPSGMTFSWHDGNLLICGLQHNRP